MLVPAVASAQPVTYSYVGPYFDVFAMGGGWFGTSNRVEVTFTTYDGHIPLNSGLQDITPYINTWSITITDGYVVFSSTDPNPMEVDPLSVKHYSREFSIRAYVTVQSYVTGGGIAQWDIDFHEIEIYDDGLRYSGNYETSVESSFRETGEGDYRWRDGAAIDWWSRDVFDVEPETHIVDDGYFDHLYTTSPSDLGWTCEPGIGGGSEGMFFRIPNQNGGAAVIYLD